jgi:hypothetical protein
MRKKKRPNPKRRDEATPAVIPVASRRRPHSQSREWREEALAVGRADCENPRVLPNENEPPEKMGLPKCACSLEKLLPSEHDRQAIYYLTYQIKLAGQREARIAGRSKDDRKGFPQKVTQAVENVMAAAEIIERLNCQWFSVDARRLARIEDGSLDLRRLPAQLRIACDAYKEAMKGWTAKKHSFLHDAKASLLGYVKARTGGYHYSDVADHLVKAGLLPKYRDHGESLRRWRQHHRGLVEEERGWVKTHLIDGYDLPPLC